MEWRVFQAISNELEAHIVRQTTQMMTHELFGKDIEEEDRLLTEPLAARKMRLSTAGLRKMRWRGTGPKYLRLGRLVRYRLRDIENWLDSK